MKRLILFFLLCASLINARYRHVPLEWNTEAICLAQKFWESSASWYYLEWLGTYYQTEEWWIYHCDKGWLYPESDGAQGVWFYWSLTKSWVWTHSDVYPFAYNTFDNKWFDFCVKPTHEIIAHLEQ